MNEYENDEIPIKSITAGKQSTPQYFDKFEKTMQSIKEKLYEQRKQTDLMIKEIKYVEKTAARMMEKEKKKYEKQKDDTFEKKKGFTKPVKISESLAKFMNMPKETMISRTDVTKFLMQYIKEKRLENPDNRRQIWPNDDLWELLGETARNEPILTHFNLQKYMNIHYIKMNE